MFCFAGVKRLLGRNLDDQTFREDIDHWPYEVVNDNGNIKIKVKYKGEYKTFFPEQVSSMVLRQMKKIAEAYLGTAVHNAAISMPANFNNAQRQATMVAGTTSGFSRLWTINEPSAAAIAYRLSKNTKYSSYNVLIFDIGGGTIEVSIVNIDDSILEIISTAGCVNLGGEDFDNRLVNHFVKKFEKKHHRNLTTNKRALMRLRASCERAKRTLSSYDNASIEIDSLFEGIDFHDSITRAGFEELNADLFRRTMEPVKKSLSDAKMNKDQVHDVVLVGGSTRIPQIQKLLQEYFNGKELNKSLHPEEAVAYGAAVHAAMLQGDMSTELKKLLLIEVTPLTLGFETRKGTMATVIMRNTAIPTRRILTVKTKFSKQPTQGALIRVFEGESAMIMENTLVGELRLRGIRSEHKVKYVFDIDAFNILRVSAFDKGIKQMVNMTNINYRFTKEDIERMTNEGHFYFNDKQHQHRSIEAKNKLNSYNLSMLSRIDSQKCKVPDILKTVLKEMCNDTTNWLDDNPSLEEEEYAEKLMELISLYNQIIIDSYKEARSAQGSSSSDPASTTSSFINKGPSTKITPGPEPDQPNTFCENLITF